MEKRKGNFKGGQGGRGGGGYKGPPKGGRPDMPRGPTESIVAPGKHANVLVNCFNMKLANNKNRVSIFKVNWGPNLPVDDREAKHQAIGSIREDLRECLNP